MCDRDKPFIRDGQRWERVQVPTKMVVLGNVRNPNDPVNHVMEGYHRMENRQGSRFRSSFTKKQIREAWSD